MADRSELMLAAASVHGKGRRSSLLLVGRLMFAPGKRHPSSKAWERVLARTWFHQAEDGPAPTWCRPGPLVVRHEAQSRFEGLLTQPDCRNQIHHAPDPLLGPSFTTSSSTSLPANRPSTRSPNDFANSPHDPQHRIPSPPTRADGFNPKRAAPALCDSTSEQFP